VIDQAGAKGRSAAINYIIARLREIGGEGVAQPVSFTDSA
jgi:hypothetical protein